MERLNAEDQIMLWGDEIWPQDIGAIAILDGRDLLDEHGQLRVEAVRRVVEGRLHLVPRFRQLLRIPGRGLGGPLWVDAPAVDLADHVRVVPLPAPGDEAALLREVERLRRQGLDRSRPLWQMWFLTGLPDGRVGLFVSMHHTIADGVAGVALGSAFLDAAPGTAAAPGASGAAGTPGASGAIGTPGASGATGTSGASAAVGTAGTPGPTKAAGTAGPPAPAWTPAAPPTARDLFVDNLQRQASQLGHTLSALVRPARAARQIRGAWPELREFVASQPAPATSLNRMVGADRNVALIRTEIDQVKQIAHRHGATVNDVLLDAIAGGLRELFTRRGEPVDGLIVRVAVPRTLRPVRERAQARGNLVAQMLIPLPVGVPDPGERLVRITAETAVRKARSHTSAGTMLRSRLARRAMLTFMKHRPVNVTCANMHGPKGPVYLAGSRLLEVFPVLPLTANVSLGVGALSYAGQFNITVIGDRDTYPDLAAFATGVEAALRSLAATLPQPSPPLAGADATSR